MTFKPGDYVQYKIHTDSVGFVVDAQEAEQIHPSRQHPSTTLIPVRWAYLIYDPSYKDSYFYWNDKANLIKLSNEEGESRMLMYLLAHGQD